MHQTPTQPKHFTPGVDRTPIRTTNFDAVFASVPQSVVAARVVSGNGEHYEPDINYRERRHWESPPPMVPLKAMDGNTQAVARELIGKRSGRLVVIGLTWKPEGQSKKAPAPWVIRCDCGHYETRSAKAIRNPKNPDGDRCQNCNHVQRAQWRYETLGPRPFEDYIGDGNA